MNWLRSFFCRSPHQLPATPSLGPLRVPRAHELPRIALVAACGFYYSPIFHYERPKHKIYPEDTFSSYHEQFTQMLNHDEFVVLVAEDRYEPDENSKSEAVFPDQYNWDPPIAGTKVIVGVVSFKLAPFSKFWGRYCDQNGI
jgi:hypothetical protein